MLTIEAEPQPFDVEPISTAVLVIDMQNDFGAPGGMFDRAGIDITAIRSVIGPTARVLSAARAAQMKIVYLKMGFQPDLSDLGASGSPNRVKHGPMGVGEVVRVPGHNDARTLIRGHWGTEIVHELQPDAGDEVLWKHRYSGFFETELDAILKKAGVRFLIVTGCTTSVCVESTVRDAMFRDYRCLVLSDCTAEPIGSEFRRTNHEASLLVLQTLFGWISSSANFLEAVASRRDQQEPEGPVLHGRAMTEWSV